MTYGRTLGLFAAKVILGAALLAGGTGCGGFNLKVVWAITEDTPMQAVVRRADAARATGTNVERLLSGTAVDDDSKWVPTIAVKKDDALAIMNAVSSDPEYRAKTKPLKIVVAEAWAGYLSKVCPTETKNPSLLAEISADVAAQYADIASQAKKIAKIKSDIGVEESARDDPERASEKADHEAKIKELNDTKDKTEAEYKPKIDAFRAKLKEDMAKVADPGKQLFIAATALKRAVEDAKTANAAATIGYPKAFPGLKDEAKFIVKRIAADTVEAQIQTRPNTEKLNIDIKIAGGVAVTIAGLAPEDIGRLKVEDVIKDAVVRSKDYIVHIVTLLGYIKETADLLELQGNILDDILVSATGDPSLAGEDVGSIDISASAGPGGAAASASVGGGAAAMAGKPGTKRIPVPMEACVVAVAAPVAATEGGAAGAAAGATGVAGAVAGSVTVDVKDAKGKVDPKAKGKVDPKAKAPPPPPPKKEEKKKGK